MHVYLAYTNPSIYAYIQNNGVGLLKGRVGGALEIYTYKREAYA